MLPSIPIPKEAQIPARFQGCRQMCTPLPVCSGALLLQGRQGAGREKGGTGQGTGRAQAGREPRPQVNKCSVNN